MKKIVDFSRADGKKRKNYTIFRRFRLNLCVFNASAEGASEKFRLFYRGTAYDVIIFKFQWGHSPPCPLPPLLTPMKWIKVFVLFSSVVTHEASC